MIRRTLGRLLRVCLVLGLLYLLAGFFTSRISPAPPLLDGREVARLDRPALDPFYAHVVRGVLSVHSGRSHDAEGTLEEVAAAAERTGLDFVVLGDHVGDWIEEPGAVAPRRVGTPLLVPGLEMVVEGRGRVLVFGLDTLPQRWEGELDELVERVDPEEGFVSVVHPRSPRTRESWKSQVAEGTHAWESFDVSEMARARLKEPWALYHLVNFLAALPVGRADEVVVGMWRERFETPAILAYDSIRTSAFTTLTGGLNHHPKARIAGGLFPAYEPFFRSVVNHVALDAPLAEDPYEARGQLARGLRGGRVFVSLGHPDEAEGFRVWVEGDGGRVLRPGDRGDAEGDERLLVRVPTEAPGRVIVAVVRDGRHASWVRARPGETISLSAGTGVVRVEVYHAGAGIPGGRIGMRPWLLSNPIELR